MGLKSEFPALGIDMGLGLRIGLEKAIKYHRKGLSSYRNRSRNRNRNQKQYNYGHRKGISSHKNRKSNMIRNRNQKAKKENIQPFLWSVSGAVRGDGGGRAQPEAAEQDGQWRPVRVERHLHHVSADTRYLLRPCCHFINGESNSRTSSFCQ